VRSAGRTAAGTRGVAYAEADEGSVSRPRPRLVLESSNPANLARYQSVGFTARDTITSATGHIVTTMWRPAC
jgi:hypothetical protein